MSQRQCKATGVVAVMAMLLAIGAVEMHNQRASAQATEVPPHAHDEHAGADQQRPGGFAGIHLAVAVVHPTRGNEARGHVYVWDHGDHVHVNARVQGLEPNSRHGFHVHEYGDCTAPDGTSAGGHYNPEGHPHGLPNDGERHAGDFGNLQADAEGVAVFELVVDNITIAGERNPVLGRAVIVHAGEDDGSQPLGDAGPRIGCGVIGVAQPRQ